MQKFHFNLRLIVLLLLCSLLAACSSGGGSPQASSTPTPTATPPITPTPTPPTIASQEVHFTTADHIKLAGMLYSKSGTTAIICSHELNSTKAIWQGTVPWFAARGFMVLAYDFRGNGESEGRRDSAQYSQDLLAAITFVKSQGAKKVILLGASMGGSVSLDAACQATVAGVVTLSAPLKGWVEEKKIPAITAPKLFINSQEDTYAQETQHMFDIAQQPKEIHIYPGSAHGTAIFGTENSRDLIDRIIAFTTKNAPQ
jgi:dienelactone hydrolase